ncbi:MAG: sigma-70 family RNA polymerase sigma factor, partial [Clostridia bacterium]|nr:sigma-70 family RNA polymerase sigma factor [Clostridia bacterium]
VGCLGLVKALNNFDPRHKVMFSTYAVRMIIGEIRRYIREWSSLKVNRSLRDTAYQAMQARERLLASDIEDPTLHDIAAEMKVPIREVVCALDAIADPISLYEPAFNDGEDSLLVMDQLSDGKLQEERWVEMLDLKNAIRSLPSKEKDVLMMRYFEGKTQIEVSTISGISQAQVSRLENNAIAKLRRDIAEVY